ncbi:hypothetical protein QZH41_001806 [Actinostola sp. cb2023]|nr:hypothetical protein QZH41_001806 [Actinostola sp. cb2023]
MVHIDPVSVPNWEALLGAWLVHTADDGDDNDDGDANNDYDDSCHGNDDKADGDDNNDYDDSCHGDIVVLQRDCFGKNPWFYCYVAVKESEDPSQNINSSNALNCKKELVGFALYHHAYSTWKGRMLYLEDLYVIASERMERVKP